MIFQTSKNIYIKLLDVLRCSLIMARRMNIKAVMHIYAHTILRSLNASRDVSEIRPDSFFLPQEEDQKNVVPHATEAIR